MAMTPKEVFFNWLIRKYGWGEERFAELEEDFQISLLREFNEIRKSYRQPVIYMFEIKE